MRKLLSQLLRCQSGATAIEYTMIAALIAIVVIGGATIIGQNTANSFDSVSNAVR